MKEKAMSVPTLIQLTPSRYRIYARLCFSKECHQLVGGMSVKQIIMEELHRQFSHQNPYLENMIGNEYDFPSHMGERIKIAAKFEEVTEPPYVYYRFFDFPGISMVPMFVRWRHHKSKKVYLFNSDIRTVIEKSGIQGFLNATDEKKPVNPSLYSALTLGKIAVHEFGHAIGINDLYGGTAPYALAYRQEAAVTKEMPQHDIMRTHFIKDDWFTPNDLEMAWLAQETNSPQTHVPLGKIYRGLRKQSEAVRLQATEPRIKKKKKK